MKSATSTSTSSCCATRLRSTQERWRNWASCGPPPRRARICWAERRATGPRRAGGGVGRLGGEARARVAGGGGGGRGGSGVWERQGARDLDNARKNIPIG